MTIDTSGNVGIGTTTPGYKLTVNSSNATDNLFQVATTTNQGIMVINNAGNVGIGTTGPGAKLDVAANADNGGPDIRLTDLSANADSRIWHISNARGDDPYGTLGFHVGTTAGGGPSATSKMVISKGGNVGIGTAGPLGLLTVYGDRYDAMRIGRSDAASFTIGIPDGSVDDYLEFKGVQAGYSGYKFLADDGTNLVEIEDSGNVGIGTTTPVSTLSVQGSLCVRDTGSCGTAAGNIYATTVTITDIDLAENYQTTDSSLMAGEIVSLDLSNAKHIKRASRADTTPTIGVISTARCLVG